MGPSLIEFNLLTILVKLDHFQLAFKIIVNIKKETENSKHLFNSFNSYCLCNVMGVETLN